jgi:ribose transport system permease protein
MHQYATLIVFILILVFASIVSDVFLTGRNITNLLRQVSALGVVSFGMLMVILTGGIDLSVGSVMALSSVVFATSIQEQGFIVALVLACAVCLLSGSVTGFLVSMTGMAPFVASLAMMTVVRGVALIVSNGSPILIENATVSYIGQSYIVGIPFPVVMMAGAFGILFLMLRYTAMGRIIKAIGSNESAVVLTGINVGRHKFSVYAMSGVLCAIGGIITTARTSVGSPIISQGFELDAIAAVVIGGASLAGGRGTIVNTVIGVVILGIISNIMNLMDIPGYHQQVVKGAIIVVAVLTQTSELRQRITDFGRRVLVRNRRS